jgi:hypothetical protein
LILLFQRVLDVLFPALRQVPQALPVSVVQPQQQVVRPEPVEQLALVALVVV